MTDRELANKILDGDTELYSEVVRRYSSVVFSTLFGITKNREEAAELSQRTFVRAYERLEYFRSENLGGWILTIAYHLCIDELEKGKRLKKVPAEGAADISQAEYSAERERRLEDMERAVAALPEGDRDIIRMRYFLGLSTAEIASEKNMSLSNVLVRLHRTREKLKKQLDKGEYGND